MAAETSTPKGRPGPRHARRITGRLPGSAPDMGLELGRAGIDVHGDFGDQCAHWLLATLTLTPGGA